MAMTLMRCDRIAHLLSVAARIILKLGILTIIVITSAITITKMHRHVNRIANLFAP